jgi:hypothetical protein
LNGPEGKKRREYLIWRLETPGSSTAEGRKRRDGEKRGRKAGIVM